MKNLNLAVLLFAGLLTSACGGMTAGEGFGDGGPGGGPPPPVGTPGGDLGATPGGVQDMALARELINQGKVPPVEAFVVEGMFSEHDLPLSGPACTTLLCLRGALGIAPNAENTASAWAQVGLSSTVDPTTFVRPSLTVVATVDVSGSMGYDYNGEKPIDIARDLLNALTAELGEDDEIAIVAFGTGVSTPLALTHGADPDIAATISALAPGGSTNLEAGLDTAYAIAEARVGVKDQTRVLLFTDLQPNVGADTPGSFQHIAKNGAAAGVGITIYGNGVGLGSEFLVAMSHLRGGNAFSLMAREEVTTFMEDHWPWHVSPIAYDFAMSVSHSDNANVRAAYGFPAGDGAPKMLLEVSTIFLSKGKGALLLELEPLEGEECEDAQVELALSYEALDGTEITENLFAVYDGTPLDGDGVSMPQPGIDKATALALLVSEMRRAAFTYQTDHAAAIQILEPALDRFNSDSARISDSDIDVENAFWPKLLELMENDAEQGNFYPG